MKIINTPKKRKLTVTATPNIIPKKKFRKTPNRESWFDEEINYLKEKFPIYKNNWDLYIQSNDLRECKKTSLKVRDKIRILFPSEYKELIRINNRRKK